MCINTYKNKQKTGDTIKNKWVVLGHYLLERASA